MIAVIKWFDLMLMSLLVGTMFGIWLGFNPATLSARTYVEQQQQMIRALNDVMPAMGLASIVLTALLAIVTNDEWKARAAFVVAVVCLIASGLITRFENQPINASVITWSVDAPPANWTEVRDEWWKWHLLRTGAGVVALSLTLFAGMGRATKANPPVKGGAA